MIFVLKYGDNIKQIDCTEYDNRIEAEAANFLWSLREIAEYGVTLYETVEVFKYASNSDSLNLVKYKDISVKLKNQEMGEKYYEKEIVKLFGDLPKELAQLGEMVLMNDFEFDSTYDRQLDAMKDAIPELISFAERYHEYKLGLNK